MSSEQIASDRAALNARLGNGESAPNAQVAAQPQVKAGGAPTTGAQPAPNTSTPEVQPDPLDEISVAAFAGPDTPQGYKFDRVPEGIQHSPEQELAVRSVFHEFGVPVAIAAQVDRLFNQAIRTPPTEQQKAWTEQETQIQLHRTYGADRERVLEVARKEFAAMATKQPMLKEMMNVSGLGNSFYVISSLYNIARARGRA
jgi:hypothetical protein